MKAMILGVVLMSCSGTFALPADGDAEFAKGGGFTQVGGGSQTTEEKILAKKQEAMKVMDWAMANNQSQLARLLYPQVKFKISLMNIEVIPEGVYHENCDKANTQNPVSPDIHKADRVFVCEKMVRGREAGIIQELIRIAALDNAGRSLEINKICGAWKLSYSALNDAKQSEKIRQSPGGCDNDSIDYVISDLKLNKH